MGQNMHPVPEGKSPHPRKGPAREIPTAEPTVRTSEHRPRGTPTGISRIHSPIDNSGPIYPMARSHTNPEHRDHHGSQSFCEQLGSTFWSASQHDIRSGLTVHVGTLGSYEQPPWHRPSTNHRLSPASKRPCRTLPQEHESLAESPPRRTSLDRRPRVGNVGYSNGTKGRPRSFHG